MIVPRNRLLFWVAVVGLPFATLGAVAPGALPVAVALMAILFVLAVLDAVLAYGSLDGIRAQLPEVVRLSKDRAGVIELRLNNARQKQKLVRLGLAFPNEIESPQEDLVVSLPAGAGWSRLQWPCRPRRRGNFRLERTHLEGASPLGFWAVRAAAPAACELRVYPNLVKESRNLAALFLNRGTFGLHAQRQVGKGRDFEKLREYIPGDSYDEIHWKATAKRGHPVTKIFQIERTQEVYVVIDASRLSARAVESTADSSVVSGQWSVAKATDHGPRTTDHEQQTTDSTSSQTSILERFITSALILGLAAERQGDLFGLLTFTNTVETFVRAKNGQAHYDACRDALYTLHPRIVTPDFDELATFIRLRLRRRALLIFLTALDDPVLAENFTRSMDLLARQHLVLVNMMKPPGANPLFTDAGVSTTDDLYRSLGGHLQWHNLRELEKVLQRRGVRFSLLDNERMSTQLVSQYVGVKQRQLI